MAGKARAGEGAGGGLRLAGEHLCQPLGCCEGDHRHELERPPLLRLGSDSSPISQAHETAAGPFAYSPRCGGGLMRSSSKQPPLKRLRCAIYTRVSTEHGLEQEFNSLDNQREAAEAYIKSQAHEGWRLLPSRYEDGGYSGGSMERPGLQQLLAAIRARLIDVVVVYKVDRLTRSLADFAKLVELFDQHGVSFVSVTQSFNTTSSMGRLTLNVLLSFAQFEREVTGERIRDKIAASKKKVLWMGGVVPLGYRVEERCLIPHEEHAALIRSIY